MSKNTSDILNDINKLILSGGRRTTAANVKELTTEMAQSFVNVVDGGLVIQSLVGYNSYLTPDDDKHLTPKKYVVDSIVTAVGAIDFSPYIKKTGEVAMEAALPMNGNAILGVTTIGDALGGNIIDLTAYTINDPSSNPFIDFSSRTGLKIYNASGKKATFDLSALTSDHSFAFPNASGTLALLSDIETYFVGKYTSLAALQTAIPTGADGDYAIVDSGAGSDAQQYIWDADDGWVLGSGSGGVTSIFGRNGVVTAQTGDYTFSQISGTVTNSQLAGSIDYSKMDSSTSASVKSFALTGTGGDGYGEFLAQASNASAPSTTGYRWFANSSGSPAWTKKNGTDTYVRSFASTNTADRTYTWQDLSYTVAGIDIAQTFTAQQTFTGSATQIASLSILDTTYKSAVDVSAANTVRYGNGFSTTTLVSSSGGIITVDGSNITLKPRSGSSRIIIGGLNLYASDGVTTQILTLGNGKRVTIPWTSSNATDDSGVLLNGAFTVPTAGVTYTSFHANHSYGGTAGSIHEGFSFNPSSITNTSAILYGFRGRANTGTGTVYNTYCDGTAPNWFKGYVATDDAFYFGDASTDGTWKIVKSGTDLIFQRRESGSYVTKNTIAA